MHRHASAMALVCHVIAILIHLKGTSGGQSWLMDLDPCRRIWPPYFITRNIPHTPISSTEASARMLQFPCVHEPPSTGARMWPSQAPTTKSWGTSSGTGQAACTARRHG